MFCPYKQVLKGKAVVESDVAKTTFVKETTISTTEDSLDGCSLFYVNGRLGKQSLFTKLMGNTANTPCLSNIQSIQRVVFRILTLHI